MPSLTQLSGPVSRLRADISGSVAIAAALMLPAIIGAVGLGVETGYWYVSQRQLQHVADVSAHAGAIRKRAGDTAAGYTDSARYIAQTSGFSGVASSVIVNSPPLSGLSRARTMRLKSRFRRSCRDTSRHSFSTIPFR
jgi:uncharacterized membrane protein